MRPLIGIFPSSSAVEQALGKLRAVGLSDDQLLLLTPRVIADLRPGPLPESHPHGACGLMAGHVVGGCIGFALGVLVGAVAILTITGIGPIVAIGTLALGGVLGALIGAMAGFVLQQTFRPTLSCEDLLVFQDARRRGHEILIVEPSDEVKAETVQQVFREAGADNTDEAWDQWWTRLRESQAAAPGRLHDGFSATDIAYLRGFEAALDVRVQGCSADQAATILYERDLTIYTEQPFRRGYEVGQAYQRARGEQVRADTLATETSLDGRPQSSRSLPQEL